MECLIVCNCRAPPGSSLLNLGSALGPHDLPTVVNDITPIATSAPHIPNGIFERIERRTGQAIERAAALAAFDQAHRFARHVESKEQWRCRRRCPQMRNPQRNNCDRGLIAGGARQGQRAYAGGDRLYGTS